MGTFRASCAAALCATAVACGGSAAQEEGIAADPQAAAATAEESGAAVASGAPRVEERYQSSIDRAWAKAVAGENPAFACAGLKGRAVGTKGVAEAGRALSVCNLDIPVRYFLTFLDQVEAGDKTCQQFATALMTQLPAMVMSTEGFEQLVAESEAREAAGEEMSDEEAQGAASGLLAGAAAEGATDRGESDPKKLIKAQIEPRVRAVCPDQVGYVLH
ncbi:MAG TPA: hypothetical protein VMT16_07740 [Thermoanaerobaculia bacterium]|nr:hypothetical protein [Thermoanaerobaculia bacterium]